MGKERILDKIDGWVQTVIDEDREEGMEGETDVPNGREVITKLLSKFDDRQSPEPENPPSEDRAKTGDSAVAYARNYGNYKRYEFLPVKCLQFHVPDFYNGRQKISSEEGIEPIFLARKAKLDVIRALEIQGLDPDEYITPATTQKTRKMPGDPKQGVIWCTDVRDAKKHVYDNFFRDLPREEGAEEAENEIPKVEIIEDLPVEPQPVKFDPKNAVECRCIDCQNIQVDEDEKTYTCGKGIFVKPRPLKQAKRGIYCDKFPTKK